MKNSISEMKTILEGTHQTREVEAQISDQEERVGENTNQSSKKKKRIKKNQYGVRDLCDDMKYNNILS